MILGADLAELQALSLKMPTQLSLQVLRQLSLRPQQGRLLDQFWQDWCSIFGIFSQSYYSGNPNWGCFLLQQRNSHSYCYSAQPLDWLSPRLWAPASCKMLPRSEQVHLKACHWSEYRSRGWALLRRVSGTPLIAPSYLDVLAQQSCQLVLCPQQCNGHLIAASCLFHACPSLRVSIHLQLACWLDCTSFPR